MKIRISEVINIGFNRGSIRRFEQERLAKEDIRLLAEIVEYAKNEILKFGSHTRLELLLGKLKRMEKQG